MVFSLVVVVVVDVKKTLLKNISLRSHFELTKPPIKGTKPISLVTRPP